MYSGLEAADAMDRMYFSSQKISSMLITSALLSGWDRRPDGVANLGIHELDVVRGRLINAKGTPSMTRAGRGPPQSIHDASVNIFSRRATATYVGTSVFEAGFPCAALSRQLSILHNA